jgi:dihydropteroate synthase
VTGLEPARFAHALTLTLGTQTYELSGRVLLMGIISTTPELLSDRGRGEEIDTAAARAEALAAAGADIIDIGDVGVGPRGAVSAGEETDRIVSVIAAIAARIALPLSVTTSRAHVLDAAFEAGAVLGRDVSGFADPAYLAVAARRNGSVVAGHTGLAPRTGGSDPHDSDDDVVIEQYFHERLARAQAAGLTDDRVLFDTGLDVGRSAPQSVRLLAASGRLSGLGRPLLLSASHPGSVRDLLGAQEGSPTDATIAAIALGVTLGCRVVRVHDVEAARRICRTLEAVLAA